MELQKIETVVRKEGQIEIGGKQISYCFHYEKGTFADNTEITSYAYTAEGENRPLIFLTNGGPGSGVVWQHLGLFGPKRIHLDDDLNPQQCAPFRLEDNPFCILDIADMVFIDPPGAGYSYLNPESMKEYASVDKDAAAVALYIELWRIEHRSANRPLYFMGESYGTVRGPALLDALYGGSEASTEKLMGISPDGIILLGSCVTTSHFDQRQGQPVEQSVLNLECCAAAYALHTGKDYRKAAEEAWEFTPEYAQALYMGNSLSDQKKKEIADRLHELIGLDQKKLLKNHLKYGMFEFLQEAVPDKMIGFYDGRYLMDGTAKPQDKPHPGTTDVLADDPAMGKYTVAFMQGQELFAEEMDLPRKPYNFINAAVNKAWDRHNQRTTIHSLENAQRRNNEMRIMFASGLFDMCTVPGGVRYVVNQSDLDMKRVFIGEYPSGHMAYLGDESAALLVGDIRKFLKKEI
ncbi:MAG: hypothetical protein IJ130_08905 [Solobacterium sp.]|nr:hypothetical protein [Solobacterium sp.]